MTEPKGLFQYINERCYELYKNDMSLEQISKEMGISELRVRESIKRENGGQIT